MGKKLELTGLKFGKLTVIKEFGLNKRGGYLWQCICDCGEEKILLGALLVSGHTKSCGCYKVEKSIDRATIHDLCEHPLYNVWNSMKQRCENKNNDHYKDYGGRGIVICEEWSNNIKNFIDWAFENKLEKGLEIDRIDNNKGYSPDNCQVITHSENMAIGKRRKQSNNTSGYNGVYYSKQKSKWQAIIKIKGKSISIGFFNNIEDAVEARIKKEIELFGNQRTNLDYKIN